MDDPYVLVSVEKVLPAILTVQLPCLCCCRVNTEVHEAKGPRGNRLESYRSLDQQLVCNLD